MKEKNLTYQSRFHPGWPVNKVSDGELLETLLPNGEGRELLIKYGSIRSAINSKSNPQLLAMVELNRRYLWEHMEKEGSLSSPKQAEAFFRAMLRDEEREVFAILFMDHRHRVQHYEELFYGTIGGATIHAREVVKAALRHNAASVVMAHNHPSGIEEPSMADVELTKKLKEALAMVEVSVLDHLVIGNGMVSFSERGLL